MTKRIGIVTTLGLYFILIAAGCTNSSRGSSDAGSVPVATAIRNTAPLTTCPEGGISVDAGIDANGNGVLDTSELKSTQYVCGNVNDQAAPVLVMTSVENAECASGGRKVSVGKDLNSDNILEQSEVTSSDYICKGTEVTQVEDGSRGRITFLLIASEPAGANCENGGLKITAGFDFNNNGIFEPVEMSAVFYVCNGTNTGSGDTQPPTVPLNLTAAAVSADQINLSWSASTDANGIAGYDVWRGPIKIATVRATAYSDTGLLSSTTYTYTVDAYDWSGNISSESAPASAMTFSAVSDTIAPDAPTGLLATALSTTEVNLGWTASQDNVGVTGYQVLRDGNAIGTTAATTYDDIGLAEGKEYSYTVKAMDAAGNLSLPSSAATVTTMSSAPTPTIFAIKLARTGQTTSYAPRDDGALQKGAVWADWPNYRFTNGNGSTPISGDVVVDQLTGLMWTRDGNTPGPQACTPAVNKTWADALAYVACLNTNSYLGYQDWRLPNINELSSVVNLESHKQYMNLWLNGQGFANVQFFYYWSSTTSAGNTGRAWDVFMGDGSLHNLSDKTTAYAVWPVRTGTYTAPALLPVTGQTTTYAAGDDGSLQKGIVWPETRFTNSDGTAPATGAVVIDRLTGLMWTRDGNAPGPTACGPATPKTWVDAIAYIQCLNTNNYLGYTDWRLPNMFEMRSLVHVGKADSAVWLNIQGFTHQQSSYYWTSTTHQLETDMAYVVNLQGGSVDRDAKTVDYGYIYVWPVRDSL